MNWIYRKTIKSGAQRAMRPLRKFAAQRQLPPETSMGQTQEKRLGGCRACGFVWRFVPHKSTIIGILRTFGSMAVRAARNRLTNDFLGFYARSATKR
jgi:hypothetical protein